MADLSTNLIKKLYYKDKLSTIEIAEKLGVASWIIQRFMVKNNLSRRNPREANAISFEKKPITYSIKEKLSNRDKQLKIAGIMLYWAEGYKGKNWNGTIDFCNCEPQMIKLFLKFLRVICGIDEKKLRVLLYCYSDQNIESIKKYWRKTTKIPRKQFIKPYIRNDFKPQKSGKMKYGLVHIRYCDRKLFTEIQNWTREFLEDNNILLDG